MSGVSVGGLLAAALVSVTVTLGLEWLAEPGLEARNERILARHRARTDVWRALDRILFATGWMKSTRSRP